MPRVQSSVIREIDYDARTATLEVTFRDGDVYAYFLVPWSVYEAFLTAPSKGRFFALCVRPVYGSRRRRPPDGALGTIPRGRPPGLGSGPGGLMSATARPAEALRGEIVPNG